MSRFDPLSSRVPLYLRPNVETEGDAVCAIACMMRTRMLPYIYKRFEWVFRLYGIRADRS